MATTILHFHLIISLLFFIFFSSSHIIIISCFARPTQEGQVPPSSVTPKAAAVHYWHLKTHSNKPLSPIFLSKLSPLSPSKFITTNDETMRAVISNGDNKVKMGKIDAPQDRHPTASGDEGENFFLYPKYVHDRHPTASDGGENFFIYPKYVHDRHPTASGDEGENFFIYHKYVHDRHPTASGDEGENFFIYPKYDHDRHPTASGDEGENLFLYHKYSQDRHPTASDGGENFFIYPKYNTPDHHATVDDDAKIATKHYNVDSNNNIKMVTGDEVKEKAAKQISPDPRGIFFRESELKEGKIIPSLKFAGKGSGQYFLPRSIASKIPFSATAISKIFQIPTDSTLYRAMKRTIGDCRMPPNIGETKQCITSAEDMIDYALSTLGANADIQFWSTHNSSEFGGKSLIGKVKVVYDSELTAKQHLTCHQVTFPYLVYHCHSVSKTRIYDIEILNAETKENINQGAVVCHLDTTGWDPNHKSFVVLASAPGMTEVCHWIPPWDMALTACDGAAATTIVAE